jgi:hypothetical protein
MIPLDENLKESIYEVQSQANSCRISEARLMITLLMGGGSGRDK